MNSVHLVGVRKAYRGVIALDGVDVTLRPGITGILGPNAAGKTTLLRLVATALTPDSGTVRLLGLDATGSVDDRTAVRRSLGYLPQEIGFPRDMTTFGFVEYMAVLKEWSDRRIRHAEVRRVIDLVGLTGQATRKVRALSGGQKRRVALAQALLGNPQLLVLDEPTAGVDPQQRALLRTILSAAGEHGTVLLARHQTEDVAAVCDRVVVLHGGRIRFDGQMTDLVATAAGRVWLTDHPVAGVRTSWRTGTGRYRSVGGPPPAGAEPAEPTLEDAYLLLLGEDALDNREVAA